MAATMAATGFHRGKSRPTTAATVPARTIHPSQGKKVLVRINRIEPQSPETATITGNAHRRGKSVTHPIPTRAASAAGAIDAV